MTQDGGFPIPPRAGLAGPNHTRPPELVHEQKRNTAAPANRRTSGPAPAYVARDAYLPPRTRRTGLAHPATAVRSSPKTPAAIRGG